jgi:hypothetical protein
MFSYDSAIFVSIGSTSSFGVAVHDESFHAVDSTILISLPDGIVSNINTIALNVADTR